jgi:hypothetical protein
VPLLNDDRVVAHPIGRVWNGVVVAAPIEAYGSGWMRKRYQLSSCDSMPHPNACTPATRLEKSPSRVPVVKFVPPTPTMVRALRPAKALGHRESLSGRHKPLGRLGEEGTSRENFWPPTSASVASCFLVALAALGTPARFRRCPLVVRMRGSRCRAVGKRTVVVGYVCVGVAKVAAALTERRAHDPEVHVMHRLELG